MKIIYLFPFFIILFFTQCSSSLWEDLNLPECPDAALWLRRENSPCVNHLDCDAMSGFYCKNINTQCIDTPRSNSKWEANKEVKTEIIQIGTCHQVELPANSNTQMAIFLPKTQAFDIHE